MPKDNKAKSNQSKKKRKSLLEQIRDTIAKTSPGGFLISKSREKVDKVIENLKK